MVTLWENQQKRMVGSGSTLMDDTVALFDDNTALFGGANPPTVWVNQVKTS